MHRQPDIDKGLTSPVVVFTILLLSAAAVYAPGFTNDYAYDSEALVTKFGNLPVGAVDMLFSPQKYWQQSGSLTYRPLTIGSVLLLDVHLFRARNFFTHGLTVAMHALNCVLLYCLISGLGRSAGSREHITAAWAGALILLLHPLATEAVYFGAVRMDVGALTGVLAAVCAALLILDGRKTIRRTGYVLAPLFALIGLGFKETAAAAFILVPLILYLFGRDDRRRLTLAALCVMVPILLVFLVLWSQFRYAQPGSQYLGGAGRALGIANFIVVSAEIYLRKLLLPWPLRINYAFEPVMTWTDYRFISAVSAVAVFLGLLILYCRRNRTALVGLALFFAGLLPVSQIVPIPDPATERLVYMPLAGLAIILGCMAGSFHNRAKNHAAALPMTAKFAYVCAAAILLLLGLITYIRGFDWRDDITLNLANWEQPRDPRPLALESIAAIRLMRAAKNDSPKRVEDLSIARRKIDELLQHQPDNASAHRLDAVYYAAVGQTDSAQQSIRQAMRLKPGDATIRATAEQLGVTQIRASE